MKYSKKLILTLLANTILISATVTYIIYTYNLKSLESELVDKMQYQAYHTMDSIDRMIYERYTDIKVIALDPVIISSDATPEQITERLIVYRNQCKAYTSLSFFDMNRIRLADTNGLFLGQKHPLTVFWRDVFDRGVSVASDIRTSDSIGKHLVYFASQVKDMNNKPIGVVVARMPITKLYDITKQAIGVPGKNVRMEVDLLDEQGLLLFSNTNIKGILNDDLSEYDSFKRAKSGENLGSLIHYCPNIEDKDLFVFAREQGYMDFTGNNWTLLLHLPVKTVYAPIYALRDRMAIILTPMFLIVFFMVLLICRTISRPILKLSKMATAVGEGNFDNRIELKSKDEIGQLADTFNIMSAKLKSYSDGLVMSNSILIDVYIQTEKRIKEALDVVVNISSLDFSKKVPSYGTSTVFDAMAEGINKLGEELEASIEELKSKEHQQSLISDFGLLALESETDLDNLMKRAVSLVAKTLKVEYCKILKLSPNKSSFILQEGVGWEEGLIGKATVSAGVDSHAGYTLITNEPIIVTDLKTETRFKSPKLLRDHGVLSGISVIIHGKDKPYGVMGAHTTRERKFSNNDIHFFQSIANMLSTAIERKQVDEKIEHLASFTQLNITPILELDSSGKVIFCNNASIEILKNLNCVGNFEIFYPKDITKILELLKEGKGRQLYREVEIDGLTFAEDIHLVPLFNVIRIYARDITEAKKAEGILVKYKILVDNMSDLAYMFDTDGNVLFLNKIFEDLTGHRPEEFIGKPFAPLFEKEELEKAMDLYTSTLKGKNPKGEVRFKETGVLCEYNTFPLRDEKGEITGVIWVAHDITERNELEGLRLKEKEERYRGLIEAIPDIVYKVDTKGCFTYINKSVLKLGYEPEELIGKHFSMIFDQNEADSIESKVVLPNYAGEIIGSECAPKLFDERRISDRMTKNMEVHLLPKGNNEKKDADTTFIGLVTSFGEIGFSGDSVLHDGKRNMKVVGTVGIIRDITEKTYLQATAIRARQLSLVGELAASIAHELNSPINGVILCAELLLKRFNREDENYEMANRIILDSNHIAEVIKNLLSFSRDKGKDKEYINTYDLLSDTIMLIKAKMKRDCFSINLDFSSSLPSVLVHPQSIQQVFMNIIDNAQYVLNQKYPNKHKNKVINISGRKKKNNNRIYVQIIFQDNGTGIPKDRVKDVLNPFYTTKPRGHGTGLGLSICHDIISEQGGYIEIESVEGEYTKVIINLFVEDRVI